MRCKRKFSRLEAEIALATSVMRAKRGNRRRREERIYLCPRCGAYHLTSEPLATRHVS